MSFSGDWVWTINPQGGAILYSGANLGPGFLQTLDWPGRICKWLIPSMEITLSSSSLRTRPGDRVETAVQIYNDHTAQDTYSINLEGLDQSWWDISIVSTSLYPGDSCVSTISMNPPRHSSSAAGTYDFSVIVSPQSSPIPAERLSGHLNLEPYHSLSVNVMPVDSNRRGSTYRLNLCNEGNTPLQILLSGRDPRDGLVFRFEQESPTVGPGKSLEVGLTVTPKRRSILGRPRVQEFLVKTISLLPGSVPDLALVSITVHPHIPVWIFWVALLVMGAVAVATGVAVIAESY